MQTNETFLQNFLRKTAQNYTPAKKKGTNFSKGEKLQGFLQPKFNACVACALLNLPKREIAKDLEMSHDVLRRFCIEPEFKEKIKEIQKAFISTIMRHLKRRGLKQFELTQSYLVFHADQFGSSTPPPLLSHREFRDIKSYHKVVIVGVMDKIDELQIKLNTSEGSDLRHWLKGVLHRFATEVILPYFSKNWENYNEKLTKLLRERDFDLPQAEAHTHIPLPLT
jgi:hypothetical protein